MICLHDTIFFIPLYGIGGGDAAVVRKELSDVLKHEIFRSGSVLRSTFFTILSLLLAVLLIFQILLYGNAYRGLRDNVRESGEAFLTLAAKLADESFGRLCDAAAQLSWDDNVLQAALFPDSQNRPRNFQIVTALKEFAAGTRYVTDVVLLCNHDSSAYSSGGDVGWLSELPAAADFSARTLGSAGSADATLVYTDAGTLCLRYPFIPCSYGHVGELLLYLDADALFSSLCSGEEPLSVYAADGLLLYSNLDTPLKPGGNILERTGVAAELTFCHRYTSVHLPLDEYLTSNHVLLVLVILLVVLVQAALAVAWLFYRPLRKTLQALRGSDDLAKNAPGNDWELLNRSVVALSRDTAQFRSIIRTISPYVLCQLLCELVDGAELDGDSVRQTLSSLPDTLPCEGTFLLFVTSNSVSGILNPAAMDHTIKNLQNIQFPHWRLYSFAYQYSILTVACLQDRQTVSDGEVEDLTRTIRVFTHNLPNSAVVCSPRFCDLLQIRGVYQALVSHSQASAARQVSRADIEKRIHQTVGGITDHSEEAAVTTLQHLLSTIRRAELPGQETLACCRMLAGEMQELSRAYRGKLGAFAPEEDAPTEEYYRQMHAYLHAAVREIFTNLDNRQRKYLLAAKKYVGEHYMDSTLSLDGTAAQLGISPSYLSRIFSEVDGKRFTQYLSDLRIEQAKRLLADESKLVRDVGQEVGFLTVQNFMRVFKSKTGVTPSEYRSTLPRKS